MQVIAPALVQVVRREAPAVLLQFPTGRLPRRRPRVHVALLRQPVALAEVARAAGGADVVPGRAPAAGARHDVVEGEVLRRPPLATVLALESVAQEHVE